jgi:hypothetical protein
MSGRYLRCANGPSSPVRPRGPRPRLPLRGLWTRLIVPEAPLGGVAQAASYTDSAEEQTQMIPAFSIKVLVAVTGVAFSGR